MDSKTPMQRVGEVLAEKKIQQKALAEAIGVPNTTLHTWLHRGGDFPASYVDAMAKHLGVNPLWIINGQDSPIPSIPESYVELSDDELFLIQTYRTLGREGKVKVSSQAVDEMRLLKSE